MKKTDFIFTKQNNVETIKYELKVSDVYDENAADKASALPNIVSFDYTDVDGKRAITAYAHEDTNLEALLKKVLNKKDVLCLMSGLASLFEMGTQGIPVSYFVKDFSMLYVNEETYAVKCIVIPVKQDVMPLAEIPAFFREVISKMRFSETDTDNYVAKLITEINADDFSVNKLKNSLDAQLESMGLFISKENGIVNMSDGVAQTQTKDIKVNKLGVMNNMRRPMMNQQMPQMGQPMMNQQMPQMGQPMMNQQMPQMGQPMMNQQMPQMGQPMMNQQMPQMPQMGQPMMNQQMPQMPQPVAPVVPKPVMSEAPKPVMPEAPKPVMPEAPKPVIPEAPKPMMPEAPKPVIPEAPKPVMPEAPKPVMPVVPKPVMPEAPKPVMPEVPKPVMPNPTMPNPTVHPVPRSAMTGQIMANSAKPIEDGAGVGETVVVNNHQVGLQPGITGQIGTKPIPHLVRKNTGEIINITKPEFSIGKSKTKADYAIENNTAISRVHCIVVQKDGVNYIKDNGSTNHTFINGIQLEPGKEVLLKNKTIIRMGDEEFTFLLRKGE